MLARLYFGGSGGSPEFTFKIQIASDRRRVQAIASGPERDQRHSSRRLFTKTTFSTSMSDVWWDVNQFSHNHNVSTADTCCRCLPQRLICLYRLWEIDPDSFRYVVVGNETPPSQQGDAPISSAFPRIQQRFVFFDSTATAGSGTCGCLFGTCRFCRVSIRVPKLYFRAGK